MSRSARHPTALLARAVIMFFAITSAVWIFYTGTEIYAEAAVTDFAPRLLSGQSFRPETMVALTERISASPTQFRRGSYFARVATVRLRLVEDAITTRSSDLPLKLAELRIATALALSSTPTDSFMWLVKFWLDRQTGEGPSDPFDPLRMSYAMGPQEGWIAQRRLPLALEMYDQLPADLARLAVDEFAGLVRSGLNEDAATIAERAREPVRSRLLSRLAALSEQQRRAFAEVVFRRDLNFRIPGVEPRPAPKAFVP